MADYSLLYMQIMMKDQFANYVVQKILETCTDERRELLLNRIRIHLPALKKYTYGKHIVARVELLSGEGQKSIYTFLWSMRFNLVLLSSNKWYLSAAIFVVGRFFGVGYFLQIYD